MNGLHIKGTLKSFLYDLNNFITIYDNYLYVFNYQSLNKLSSKKIELDFSNWKIVIYGEDLNIRQMTKQELLLQGTILKVEFNYE